MPHVDDSGTPFQNTASMPSDTAFGEIPGSQSEDIDPSACHQDSDSKTHRQKRPSLDFTALTPLRTQR
jgi:hypothetical protein